MQCPICKKPVDPRSRVRPFCSERCKLLDLGNWLDGKYAIPGEPASDEDPESDAAGGDIPNVRRRS